MKVVWTGYIEDYHKQELETLAIQRTEATGRRVRVADLMRESLDIFLGILPQKSAQTAASSTADYHQPCSCKQPTTDPSKLATPTQPEVMPSEAV